jgi:hypothetical protein
LQKWHECIPGQLLVFKTLVSVIIVKKGDHIISEQMFNNEVIIVIIVGKKFHLEWLATKVF